MATLGFDACPVCGSDPRRHTVATKDEHEMWTFFCGAEIIKLDNGKFLAESACEKALENAVDYYNCQNQAQPETTT